jgi:bacteriochlorophyll 4-vinyl reductase
LRFAMSEPRIGRVLVASMHQAIADVLPMRLEFYENWLSGKGLRDGTIGLAPLSAVLSFLRLEGTAYDEITRRAGEYAAEWTVRGLPGVERRLIVALPAPLRLRAALRTARGLVRTTYPGSRAIVRLHRDTAEIDLRGSLFCEVRTTSPLPLCGFYAAAIARVLQLCSVGAQARVVACRASGAPRGCTLAIAVGRGAEPGLELPEHAA